MNILYGDGLHLCSSFIIPVKADFLSWQKSLAYSLQIFADNFSLTNLLFAASKCHVTIQRQWYFKMFKMAERKDGCSDETLLAHCTTKTRCRER